MSVCDATDETKRIRFQASGNSTGVVTTIASSDTTAHTITLPNATDTLVGKTTTDTMTNKTMTGATNTLTASLLKSATTEINVSSATAPTTGQVLTATSATTATWQTPTTSFIGCKAIQTAVQSINNNTATLLNF